MTYAYASLNDLRNGSYNKRLKVKIGRIWNSVNANTNETFSTNLQLIDLQGNNMHCIIPKFLLPNYSDKFEEGMVLDIFNFNLTKADKTWRVIEENMSILINANTIVNILEGDDDSIPRYKFNFPDEKALNSRLGSNEQLTDLGGLLKGISEKVQLTTSKGIQSSKVELDIDSISGYMVKLAIWPDKQHLLDVESVQSHDGPIPIVVTSTTVTTFRGIYSYSTSKASKIYLGIEIPEISSIINSEGRSMDQSIVMHMSQSSGNAPQLETVHTNLEQLLEDVISLNCRGKVYVVNATVLAIDTQTPWHYLSCPVCKSGVIKTDQGFTCNRCHTDNFDPIQRFRIGMQVFDKFKSTEITMFDKQAEAFIGRTISEMMLIQNLVPLFYNANFFFHYNHNTNLLKIFQIMLLKDKGTDKIQQIFGNLHGIDATFEFKPSNKDILNKGVRMAPTKVTKQHQFANEFDNDFNLGTAANEDKITEDGENEMDDIDGLPDIPNNTAKDTASYNAKGKAVMTEKSIRNAKRTTYSGRSKNANKSLVINDVDDNSFEPGTPFLKSGAKKKK